MFIWSHKVFEFAVNCGLASDRADFLQQWRDLTIAEREEWAVLSKENGYA